MGKHYQSKKIHILILPFPAQGHVNPAIQLSKRLASKELKVTLATTLAVTKSIQTQRGNVALESFSDGCDEGGVAHVGSIEKYMERFELFGSKNLRALVEKYNDSEYPIKCLVYDSVVPWAHGLAKQLGLIKASFFAQPCAVNAIYHHVYHGSLSVPIQGSTISLPGLPILDPQDLPSFVSDAESYPCMLNIVLNQFSNAIAADLILFNTFDKLEEEVVDWAAKQWPNKALTIGPTIPSMYLDKQSEGDKDYGLDLFAADSSTCISWLNTKETKSVVYVSFGSLANIGEEQMDELAWGLKGSGYHFLWVVGASAEFKLPNNFVEEISGKGLVITWCPQLEVLAHQAVGCFITHCGWNSTLEALALGVPMIMMPQWADQMTNAKFAQDVWKVGVRPTKNEKGIVRREEIQQRIVEVMEGERGKEIHKSSARWKVLAKEAVVEGGSSDRNIEAIAARLLQK